MAGRCLFVDMNAFFASVEQQERPELRGRPVIVTPVAAETTCAIAASYEAKALGIKTGTPVKAARKLCPDIAVVEARPTLYVNYHAGILEALKRRFVSVKALSVDEMACGIGRLDASPEGERRLALQVKQDIRERLGSEMRCSIGIAPNVFLAKVASDSHKPDGLTIFNEENFPKALFELDLLDLPGIGRRMLLRLERQGITTVQQLYDSSESELRWAWGSVVGLRWWYMLHGSQLADYGAHLGEIRKTVGHSHVLPPEFRNRAGAQAILARLFSKALKRLRAYEQAASAVELYATFRHTRDFTTYHWRARSRRHLHTNDEGTWIKIVRPMIESMSLTRFKHQPVKVGIVFSGLLKCEDQNLSLFEGLQAQSRLSKTLDALNARFDCGVELASVYALREQAPYRIAFGQLT